MPLTFLCPSCGELQPRRGRCSACRVLPNARHNARPQRVGYATAEYRKAREVALARAGGACEVCGSTDHVQVHHVDRDTANNDQANLDVLCGRCHREEHA